MHEYFAAFNYRCNVTYMGAAVFVNFYVGFNVIHYTIILCTRVYVCINKYNNM